MGRLVDGNWIKTSIITSDPKGAYDRLPRTFRSSIDQNHAQFQPESGRYHLYVSYACPWAHRTLIYRSIKDLEEHISVDVVHPDMLEMGWSFRTDYPKATGDTLFQLDYLHQIYQKAQSDISTSATVPVLWDKKTNQIVNNESSEIIRIFNSSFNDLTGNREDFYPVDFRSEIDALNEKIYHNINNAVYRAGFAKSQEAYDEAVTNLFQALDDLDTLLEGKDYLVGDRLSEADIRLIPTLLRFDVVYFTHFKCNIQRICDYKNLSRYLKSIYALKAVQKTTDFDHIKRHYYYSHESINPFRIIAQGPKRPI